MDISLNQLLGRAVAIAAIAHQDQLDKAHAPYILHPLRLLMRGETIEEQIVAVLHDVVEDSDWTLAQLAAEGFPAAIVTAIECLTRRAEETYDQFLDRVLTSDLATRIKRYDLEDNMTLTRLKSLSEKDLQRLQRYHQAHQRIMNRIQTGSASAIRENR
jgi:hypothetical protein